MVDRRPSDLRRGYRRDTAFAACFALPVGVQRHRICCTADCPPDYCGESGIPYRNPVPCNLAVDGLGIFFEGPAYSSFVALAGSGVHRPNRVNLFPDLAMQTIPERPLTGQCRFNRGKNLQLTSRAAVLRNQRSKFSLTSSPVS